MLGRYSTALVATSDLNDVNAELVDSIFRECVRFYIIMKDSLLIRHIREPGHATELANFIIKAINVIDSFRTRVGSVATPVQISKRKLVLLNDDSQEKLSPASRTV